MRRFHRWLALPFIALLLIVSFSDMAQRVQAPLMISMALTGTYLWLLPYLTKWRRSQRRAG